MRGMRGIQSRRLCSLLLCAALLCGLCPGLALPAAAADTGEAGAAAGAGAAVYDAAAVDEPNAGNPFIPGNIGDPNTYYDKSTGTFYVVGTMDTFGVWESKDFVHWTFYSSAYDEGGFPFREQSLWAPSMTKGPDGRYYLYYIYNGTGCYVVSAETPRGPWRQELGNPGDSAPTALHPGMFDSDVVTLHDGKSYVITMYGNKEQGTWGVYMGELNDDMVTLKDGLKMIYTGSDLFEGPGLFERQDEDGNWKYYLTYSNGSLEGSYHVNVAYSDTLWGPYAADEASNPILAPDYPQGTICTGHSNIFEVNGKFYICYHRKWAYQDGALYSDRQACLEEVRFYSDGTIRKIHPTVNGARPDLPVEDKGTNIALDILATSSSEGHGDAQRTDWVAGYAFDNNFATRWEPAGSGDQWLIADLGSIGTIERVETYFKTCTQVYRYKLETSLDGEVWTEYADRMDNTSRQQPAVDTGTVKARYLRLTLSGDNADNGVYEMQVYGTPGPNLRMKEILVNGEPIEGFSRDRFEYVVYVPDVEWANASAVAEDPSMKVECIVEPEAFSNTYFNVVCEETGEKGPTYYVDTRRLGNTLTGTPFGTLPTAYGKGIEAAFDGDRSTSYEYTGANGGAAGLDLGNRVRATVTGVSFVPAAGNASRMVGGYFQGSNDGSSWTTLVTITEEPDEVLTALPVENAGSYRFLRYCGPNGSYGSVAELGFYGETTTATAAEALQSSIDYAGSLTAGAYTQESYAAVTAALETAKAVPAGAADAEKIAAADALDQAVHALSGRDDNEASVRYPKPADGYLYNAGFENSADTHWQNTWGIKDEAQNAHDGTHAVNINSSGSVRQTITGLAPGTYTFSVYVQGAGKGEQDTLDAYAASGGVVYITPITVTSWGKWGKFEVTGIEVGEDGVCSFGVNSKLSAGSSMWAWVDEASFGPEQSDEPADDRSVLVQDFESAPAVSAGTGATAALTDGFSHGSGSHSLRLTVDSTLVWGSEDITANNHNAVLPVEGGSVDASGYSHLIFYVNDRQQSNTVYVTLRDGAGKTASGWTADGSTVGQWTRLSVSLSAFSGVDLSDIVEIRVGEWNQGDYYFDNFYFASAADAEIPGLGGRVHKEELKQELSEVRALNAALYTEESMARLLAVYDEADAVYTNDKATQVMVDDLLSELRAARAALQRRPGSEVVPGDVNGDSLINSSDARLVLQHTVELITLSDEQIAAADVDNNGVVNSSDARWILQATVELNPLG